MARHGREDFVDGVGIGTIVLAREFAQQIAQEALGATGRQEPRYAMNAGLFASTQAHVESERRELLVAFFQESSFVGRQIDDERKKERLCGDGASLVAVPQAAEDDAFSRS